MRVRSRLCHRTPRRFVRPEHPQPFQRQPRKMESGPARLPCQLASRNSTHSRLLTLAIRHPACKEFEAVYRNVWVKMALSSRRQASPLRVATGGDASWRPEARRRRSPAFRWKASSPAAATGGWMPAGLFALHFIDGNHYPCGSSRNSPTDSAIETEKL